MLLTSERNGSSRAYASLRQLLRACQDEAASEASRASSGWSAALEEVSPLSGSDLLVRVELTGEHMQTARDANGLLDLGFARSLRVLASVLNGVGDPALLRDHAPHLALVPPVGPGREIWLGVYLRLALLVSIERFNPRGDGGSLAVLPQEFYNQGFFGDSAGESSVVLTSQDIRRLAVPAGAELGPMGDEAVVANPLIPAGDYYVTSRAIVLDSIAPWLMANIERSGFWQQAVGDVFEAEVQSLLRAHGFVAGEVTQGGHWRHGSTDPGAVEIARRLAGHGARSGLSGQIDVLAVRDDAIFVLECKSISTMARAMNTTGKLSPEDQDAYRSKLRTKVRWVRDAVGREIAIAFVVVEGAAVIDATQRLDDVLVVDRSFLAALLREADDARAS
jgi:hypothetical protein